MSVEIMLLALLLAGPISAEPLQPLLLSSGCWSLFVTTPQSREAFLRDRAAERFETPTQAQLQEARRPVVDLSVSTDELGCANQTPERLVAQKPDAPIVTIPLTVTSTIGTNAFGATARLYRGEAKMPVGIFVKTFQGETKLYMIHDAGREEFQTDWAETDIYLRLTLSAEQLEQRRAAAQLQERQKADEKEKQATTELEQMMFDGAIAYLRKTAPNDRLMGCSRLETDKVLPTYIDVRPAIPLLLPLLSDPMTATCAARVLGDYATPADEAVIQTLQARPEPAAAEALARIRQKTTGK